MTKSVNRLEELREARGWHRTRVAGEFGINERTVRRYESGEQDVPSALIPELAAMFEVTPEYLMGWDRESTETPA
jgi:transcriptional regulator with XRE-family HTH domain